uniref:Uncharacterized protein n=1 Tax=Anthurium amnicola TaxID=1678845 RepID=A0A1D1YSL3_9ARAE
MSSRNYEPRTGGAPYVQKINLSNNNNKKTKRKSPPKLCFNCKETKDCVNLFSNKVNRIEEIINSFHKNSKNTERISKFNAKFTLNTTPCELEYDLSNFTLENLQKLVIFTTQSCNNNNCNN